VRRPLGGRCWSSVRDIFILKLIWTQDNCGMHFAWLNYFTYHLFVNIGTGSEVSK
jgi:hypothetical protein